MRRRALIAAGVAVAGFTSAARSAEASAGPSAYSLGLAFVDDSGRPRPLADWQGRSVVMAMAYGACRKVCSTTLRRMEQLHEIASARGQALEFVVVSLDPREDRPQDWAELRRLRGLGGPEWAFLCGSEAATRRLAGFLGVRYWPYDDHVIHDFRIVRLDAQGHIAQALRWADDDLQRLL